MSTPKVEWKRAHDFAEVAKTLGVDTRDVLAMWSPDGEATTVLFTREFATPDSLVLSATLHRDADGILVSSPEESTDLSVRDMFKARP